MNHRFISSQVFILMLLLLGSCMKSDFFPCISPKGTKVEEHISFNHFQGIELKMHANVYISRASEYSISLSAPENILDYVIISQKGSLITMESNRCIRNRADEIELFVSMPDVSQIKLAGSGNIFTLDQFKGKRIDLKVSGSGNIDFYGDYETIYSTVAGSGDIFLEGHAMDHIIQINGSGKADARNMVSDCTDVKIKGSGSAWVHALDRINAQILGSGNLYYTGNPTINSQISGSGKIIQKQ